jgi:5-methylcytosine-specific restriction endonuclease McrBC GTP-binding regulatory subunit McrB
MGYEDFVEGIKPIFDEEESEQISYKIEDGIFKQICNLAAAKEETNFEEAYAKLLEDLSASEDEYLVLKTPREKEYRLAVNSNDNLSLYTSHEIKYQGVLSKNKLAKQFNGELAFKGWEGYANGVLNHLKSHYNLSKSNIKSKGNYVLIIDEINRGNVSAIFGELITLIEEDKRMGAKEGLTVTLPYSKKPFSVPKNLYIIGTMNTADRSVEVLDTALRRRFSFVEMMPDLRALYGSHQTKGIIDLNGYKLNLVDFLGTLNERIEALIDRDHQIGHSYLIGVNNLDDFKSSVGNKIIPLLQEYFYNDYQKIELILGSDFLLKKEKSKVKFAIENPETDIEGVTYSIYNVGNMSKTAFVKAIIHLKVKDFGGSRMW